MRIQGVLEQPVYEPGKPIEYVAREYGLEVEEIAKLASNENPFGPSPMAVAAGKKALEESQLYPDGGCYHLRQAIAKARGVLSDGVLIGNGSNEIIELLGHAFLRPGTEVVMGAQAFIVYRLVAKLFGAKPVEVPMKEFSHDLCHGDAVTDRTRLFLSRVPTINWGANSVDDLVYLAQSLPDHVIFCLDEAYAEYLDEAPDLAKAIHAGRKVLLRTFSKIYGLGGLRVGYGYGNLSSFVLQRVRQPFMSILSRKLLRKLHSRITILQRCAVGRMNEEGKFYAKAAGGSDRNIWGSCNFVLTRVGDGLKLFSGFRERTNCSPCALRNARVCSCYDWPC